MARATHSSELSLDERSEKTSWKTLSGSSTFSSKVSRQSSVSVTIAPTVPGFSFACGSSECNETSEYPRYQNDSPCKTSTVATFRSQIVL